MLEKYLYTNYSIIPQNLYKLELELKKRGFTVQRGLEMMRFFSYRRLSRFLYVSTQTSKAEFHMFFGRLKMDNTSMTYMEEELVDLFLNKYRVFRRSKLT